MISISIVLSKTGARRLGNTRDANVSHL